ncbi:MAG: hypothetical protein IMF16_05020 [Proteobacteria bacterium]|nr:hypothetical protein [Pseudomonadota bacterium]
MSSREYHPESSDPREPATRIQDRILLLSLFARLTHYGYIGDPVKVQKTVFLVQYNAALSKMQVFAHPYFRWEYGPFSKELKDDYRLLSGPLDYVLDREEFQMTDKGSDLAEAFWLDVLKDSRNAEICQVLEATARKWAGNRGGDIQRAVYKLRVRSAPSRHSAADEEVYRTVEDTRKSYEFLLVPRSPRCRPFIPEGWAETLAVELGENSDARDSLRQAERDVLGGHVRGGDPIPADIDD